MSFRRWMGVGSVLALGATMGLQPVGAQADAGSAVMEIAASVRVNDPGCATPTWASARKVQAVPADGRIRELTSTQTGKGAASSLTAARAVRGSYTVDARGTRRVSVRASASVSAGPNASEACSVTLFGTTAAFYTQSMTAPKRSWLVVRSSGAVRPATTTAVVGLSGGSIEDGGVKPGGSITRLVPAGAYRIGAQLEPFVRVPAQTTTTRSAAASLTATVALIPIGTLRSRSGDGLGYITAGHRDCTYDRVKATFSAAGRTKVGRATFSVDGERRFTLTGSQLQRDAIFVRSIPRASSGAIRVDIVLRTGARRTSYATSWPCA